MGIDVGSISTDVVLMDNNCKILGYSIVKSGFDHKAAIHKAIGAACFNGRVDAGDITSIVGTGYGRRNIQNADKVVTEISCHAMGVNFIFPKVKMVIDIGGQDSKVIHITDDGFTENFVMNDKCAAGTGRFLEVMSQALDVDINDIGNLALSAKKTQRISSICTVFAESEVISKIAEGCQREEIVAGIHKSIAERIAGLVDHIGIRKPIALTGGVAKNKAMLSIFSRLFECELFIPEEPQIVGALGAALYARTYGGQ